jgi:serine/threonine-protein kinase
VVIKAPEDPLVGKVLAGKYTLEARLGEGGMGAVYRARNTSDEPVAIKVIRPDRAGTSPDATRRFVREARVAMAIQSPHVVRVLEVDSDAALGAPYIVMDLLVGQDLSSQIERKGPLDAGVVCALFAQACAGLTAAHEAGVVHRDIKPANLFLHEQGDAVVVKVCDFGIAKKTSEFAGAESTASELTSTGGMLGSPYYMSPEQARNAKGVDARSDLWSLSISLYEALAGQRPWPSQMSLGELIFTITTQDVPPLAAAAPWVPEALCALVHRGLHRDPALRWGSAREMREALLPFAAATSIAREGLLSVPPAQREAASRRRPVSAAQTEAQPSTVRSLRRSRSTPLLALGGMLVAGLAAGIAWQSRPSAAVVGASSATTAGDPAAVSLSGSATSLAALPSGEPSPPTASVAAVPASASASATPALAPTGKRVSKSEPTTAHTASPQPATPTPGGSAFPVQKVWRE